MYHPLKAETIEQISSEQTSVSDEVEQLGESLRAIQETIRPYFTHAAWLKWLEKAPATLRERVSFAVTEYNEILCEFFEDVPAQV